MPPAAKSLNRGLPRDVATFEFYYSEPYNAVTQPHRFDWYLITRWLPELGPDGFTIVKVLRSLCYRNPKDGSLRDTCQLTVDELAEMCGIKRSSLYRVLEGNEALAKFVQRMPEAIHIEGRTRRLPPRWRVSMDCPIHPKDQAEYERLVAAAGTGTGADEAEKRKSQIEIYEQRKSQREDRKSQNPECKSQYGITLGSSSLPPGLFTEVSIPAGGAPTRPETPSHKCDPPGGEGEGEDALAPAASSEHESPDAPGAVAAEIRASLRCGTWSAALAELKARVNDATYKTHLRHLKLAELDEEAGTARVEAPNEFTREWVGRRHLAALEAALSAQAGREVSVRLVVAGAGAKA